MAHAQTQLGFTPGVPQKSFRPLFQALFSSAAPPAALTDVRPKGCRGAAAALWRGKGLLQHPLPLSSNCRQRWQPLPLCRGKRPPVPTALNHVLAGHEPYRDVPPGK